LQKKEKKFYTNIQIDKEHIMNIHHVVYITKWSSAHALGGVSGVASLITTDEQLQ